MRGVVGAALSALAVGGVVYGFARASGGYYANSWPLLGALLVAACATAVAIGAVPRRSLVAAALSLAGLGAIAAASVAWGGIAGPAWTTLDQALLAAAALVLGACAAATGERTAEAVIGGVGLGLCLLAVELLYRLQAGDAPDAWFDGRKIQGAVGYHNALGAFFAVGIPIALWAGVHRAVWLRAAGGAAVVGLTGGLLLTQSRGAVLAAVLAGAVLVLVVRELRTSTFALWAALAGLLLLIPLRGVDARLIDHPGGSPAEFRRFAVWTIGLGLAVAAAAALPLTRRVGRALLAVTVTTAVLGAAVGLAIVRPDPGELRARLDRVTSEGNPAYLPAGSTRLASVSLTGRRHVWRVALDAYADRPLLGEGSGRFARTWGVERWNKDLYVLQPHSLELELLSELGLPGLLALVGFVGFALAALVRSPSPRGLRAVGAAALVALLAQASVDWTFSFPALVAATMLVVGAAAGGLRRRGGSLWGGAVAGTAALGMLVLLAGPYLAQRELARAERAAAEPSRAWELARRARGFHPWNEQATAFQGRLAETSGRYLLAASLYAQAAEWSQQPWTEEFRRARALQAAGDTRRSRAACRLAQAQNPLEPKLRTGPCARPAS